MAKTDPRLKLLAQAAEKAQQEADAALTLVYVQMCRTNPAAAAAYLYLMGDWRERSTRINSVLNALQ